MVMSSILAPAAAHLLLVVILYVWLTVERALNVAARRHHYSDLGLPGGDSGRAAKVAANLRNQFEAPVLFYPLVLTLHILGDAGPWFVGLAWVFVAGRIIHTIVQTLTDNVPLRGAVFTINFGALALMWLIFLVRVPVLTG